MKVRTQLVLAFLLLAVVPLAGIVAYSYVSSLGAFREAVEAESEVLNREMSGQLAAVRGDIENRLEKLTELPVRSMVGEQRTALDVADVYVDLMTRMGAIAPMIRWLEFTPAATEGVGDSSGESFFIYPSKALARSLTKLKSLRENLEESGLSPEYFEATVTDVIRQQSVLKEEEIEALAARGEEMKELLGSEFASPVRQGDLVVGQLKAMVPAEAILREVLATAPRDEGKVPYARSSEGRLFVDEPRDREILEEIGLVSALNRGDPVAAVSPDWIVVETVDADSGLTFGIGRPIGSSLRGIRGAAVRNFSYGLGMLILAMAGIVWLSSRMTRNLTILTEGAERLAEGDLEARVPLDSRDEFGSLARTINRMAGELSENQARLLEEARLRREQEIQQRLLEAEHERKSLELEEARELQLSLLPKNLPLHPELEVAVFMRTATEVGGDYYDFFPAPDGVLTTAIGDAAGHGARAGTMVTVVKGLFTAGAAMGEHQEVLSSATRALKEMELGRMNMAVSLVRIGNGRITVSAAGMPPVLLFRQRSETVEEVALPGMPLGSFADVRYERWDAELLPGDTVLLMTDGFPELLNEESEPLGYERARSAFEVAAAKASPDAVLADLTAAADRWSGTSPLADDMTFVVMRAV
jgi:serine phosphatase RsbU (regulator of sigma subunit)